MDTQELENVGRFWNGKRMMERLMMEEYSDDQLRGEKNVP
jgi:hypothetical protein